MSKLHVLRTHCSRPWKQSGVYLTIKRKTQGRCVPISSWKARGQLGHKNEPPPLLRNNEDVNGALVSRRIMLKRMNMIKQTYVYKNKYVLVKMRSISGFPCPDGMKLN